MVPATTYWTDGRPTIGAFLEAGLGSQPLGRDPFATFRRRTVPALFNGGLDLFYLAHKQNLLSRTQGRQDRLHWYVCSATSRREEPLVLHGCEGQLTDT